jgi:WW domain-containing oxidoreductase
MSKVPGPSGFGFHSTAEEVTQGLDQSGKSYLITGSNSGIGHETARVLALRGAHIVAAARTEDKARAALTAIGHEGTPLACELSEPASVRQAIGSVKNWGRPLDGIIANAGIIALPELTVKYGVELQYLTNHIGHFILVTGLLDQLNADGRVVVLSFGAHRSAPPQGIDFDNLDGSKSYEPMTAYRRSKMANILFTTALARRLSGSKRTANSLNPGIIRTNLLRHFPNGEAFFDRVGEDNLKSIGQGAATQTFVATHPSLEGVSGAYFADCSVKEARVPAMDPELAEQLWESSAAIAVGF